MSITTVILSSKIVADDLKAEFGPIVPVELPVGGGYLYDLLKNQCGENHYVTLPKLYNPRANICPSNIIYTDKTSIADVIKSVCDRLPDIEVRILFSDCYFSKLSDKEDIITIANPGDYNYSWRRPIIDDDGNLLFASTSSGPVMAGEFVFSNISILREAAVAASGKGMREVLKEYNKRQPLRLEMCEGDFYDLGHVQSYFYFKSMLPSTRNFNSLRRVSDWYYKFSEDNNKIDAELLWYSYFSTSHYRIRRLLPETRALDNGYAVEILPCPTIAEISRTKPSTPYWETIITRAWDSLLEFTRVSPIGVVDVNSYEELYLKKVIERAEPFVDDSILDLYESLYHQLKSEIEFDNVYWHGDPVFSNILWDSRSQRVKFIDPRGMRYNNPSVTFDWHYDAAKFAQSLVAKYDYMYTHDKEFAPVHELVTCRDFHLFVKLLKEHPRYRGDDLAFVLLIMGGLLLSAGPLHSESPRRKETLIKAGIEWIKYVDGICND